MGADYSAYKLGRKTRPKYPLRDKMEKNNPNPKPVPTKTGSTRRRKVSSILVG